MEKPGRTSKQDKAKKKQIKVVYISNPMRVKTTAAEFKGLVQELTGRDSDIADRLSRLEEMERADEGAASADRGSVSTDGSLGSAACPPGPDNAEIHLQQQQPRVPYASKGTPFDMLDDVFTPQILDDFASFMPSSPYYESLPPIDDSRNLGAAFDSAK